MLLYSVRFSRRAVTRPGSGGRARSARSSSASIQAVTPLTSASSGRGRPTGGISWLRSLPRTFSQAWESWAIEAAVGYASRSRPPVFNWELWQRTQLFVRKGLTEASKATASGS